jgi:hypothetical protein
VNALRVLHVVDGGQQIRRELFAVCFNPANCGAAESHAMISACAADEPHALRLALRLPVRERDLERRVHRFRSRVPKEHVIDAVRQHAHELLRQLEGERMSHLERRRIVHYAGLFADRGGDRLPAVSRVHAPQTGGAVENLAAIGGSVVHVLRGDEHARRLFEGAIRRERHPQLLERGRCGGNTGGDEGFSACHVHA